MAKKKLTDKQIMLADKTTSAIPKTPREKKMWIRARQFIAKSVNRFSEEAIPWGAVQKVYKNQIKGNKVMKKSDIDNVKISKSLRKFRTPDDIQKDDAFNAHLKKHAPSILK